MTKIQRASIYLFLLFAGIGLEFELGHLSQQEFSQSAGRDLVLNFSVLAAIIIPLYLFQNDWLSSCPYQPTSYGLPCLEEPS